MALALEEVALGTKLDCRLLLVLPEGDVADELFRPPAHCDPAWEQDLLNELEENKLPIEEIPSVNILKKADVNLLNVFVKS